MKITVNGEPQQLQGSVSIAELLVINSVANAEMVSVQVNEEFIERSDFSTTSLSEGDSVDFLYFMGGGAC
jgi:sulfur carrier protein